MLSLLTPAFYAFRTDFSWLFKESLKAFPPSVVLPKMRRCLGKGRSNMAASQELTMSIGHEDISCLARRHIICYLGPEAESCLYPDRTRAVCSTEIAKRSTMTKTPIMESVTFDVLV